MQIQVNIGIDQLIELVKTLPEKDIDKLKTELEKKKKSNINREEFLSFLMKGPVFSKKQLNAIAKTRKAINQWRTK
jgi:hypothetical protein